LAVFIILNSLSTIEESQSSIQLDLSYDNTGDDLDASFRGNPGSNRKKRPSAPPVEEEELTPHSKKRSKAGKSPSKSRKNVTIIVIITRYCFVCCFL